MSSSVITPAKPPYSSTTQAIWRCPDRSRSSTAGSGSVAGTSSGATATARTGVVGALGRRHAMHVGDADHADHVVDAVGAAHGEAGVPGLQQVDDPADRLVGARRCARRPGAPSPRRR